MGDSQVACALSGAPVYNECVVIVLGPGGYGDHSAPPRLAAGGLHLGPIARSEPIYAPLTLPIRAIVNSYRGAIVQCLDDEHDQWLREHWGAGALEIANAAIEGGCVTGDRFKDHVAQIDHERSWNDFDASDEGIEAYVAASRSLCETAQGIENCAKQARIRALEMRRRKEEAKRNAYGASWADALHVRADVWDELVVPRNDDDEEHADPFYWLSAFSRGLYEKHGDKPHIQALGQQLERFFDYAISRGHLMPSVMFNEDWSIAKNRARLYEVAARLAKRDLRDQG